MSESRHSPNLELRWTRDGDVDPFARTMDVLLLLLLYVASFTP